VTRRPPGRAARAAAGPLAVAATLAIAACVSSGAPRRVEPQVVDAAVIDPPSRSGATMGPFAWGLGDASADRTSAAQAQDPQETQAQRDARLRVQFGSTVLIAADGTVTKQYFFAGDLAQTFLKLITNLTEQQKAADADRTRPLPPAPGTKIGGAANQTVLGRMLRDHEIEVTFIPDFEVLSGVDLVDQPNQPNPAVRGSPLDNKYKSAPSVGLALISASPSALAAFEGALDLFYSSIPQVEITVQIVEYQTADALAFGVTGIDQNTPVLGNLSSSQLVRAYSSVFPLRGPIVGNSPVTDLGRFTLGGIHDNWELNAVLQALESNNLADITSSPKLVVRNGGVASISTLTMVPFPKARISQLGAEVAQEIEFKPVGVKMNIVPIIAGTDSVILQVWADVSAVTSFVPTLPVTTPITATRSAMTTVYLRDDHTLVIGGLNAKTLFESENKVPILGDIPILGFLFRSTTQSRNETKVEFLITPRIVKDRGSPLKPTNL
jgi:hypothetical protein